MVDNYPLTIDSNTEIEPLDSVRDVRMRGQSVTQDRVANIPQMTGATSSSNGGAGVVPAPNVADRDKYLKGDGTWAEVSASGSNVQVTQVLSEGTKIATISVDDVPTDIFAPEGGGTVTDVVDGDGTSLVDENGVAHVLGEVTDVVDKNDFSLVNNNVAKIPIEVDSTICSPIPDYANITDIEESKSWISTNTTYTWTAPCDCLLVPVVNNDTDFVEYTIDDFVLYSSWNNDSISTVNAFPIGYELIPLAKDTEISIRFLHRADSRFQVRYRYIPFKRLQTNQESYSQPYLDYRGIRTVSVSDIQSGYTAFTDGVFIGAYSNSSNTPVSCYINEESNKYYYMAVGNTPGSSMRLGEGDTIRISSTNISGSGWFIPFATTDDPTEVYLPVPDYSNATSYTESDLSQDIPMGFLFNDNRHTTQVTTSLLTTVLVLNTPTVVLNLNSISPVPTYEETRYNCVAWFPLSGEETFNAYYPASPSGEVMEGSFVNIPYSTQNILVEGHFNVDDVVDGNGNSLVDANGIAHVTAKVKDVLYDDVSVVNDDGVAELFTQRKPTILPLLDYENEVGISASTSWRDTTVRKWTAPCDCVFYIFDQAGNNNTFVRYVIDDFVYYGTCMSQNHTAPYGLLSNMIPLKKGQEISIQFQGQMMNNIYTKAFYIPYKTVDESAESFPLPYLDHNNRISIDYSTTSFTAPTDGMVVDYGNSVHSIVVHTDVSDSTFYGKGGSQYFDCSIPLSAGDNVTLGTGSSKYFIPFKRTTNINRLVSPIPDYANRIAYTGDVLPTSFSEPGFLFLCAHDYTQYSSSASATYNINSQASLDINAYKYTINSTAYWKDSFAPVDETMIKSYVSTGTNINYYFIPYSEFNTVYVKDILVGGASVVGDGSVARIESLVTDVQLNGESLVSDGGVANITGKVFDVQFEGISILDNNEVANIKTPILTAISPVLDYANAQYITESATWKDRNEHTWTAPCDCAIWYSAPNSGSSCFVKYTIGTFKYETYRTAYGAYNNINLSNYESMLPVAEGTTVTIQFNGSIDSTGNDPRLQYIPYKKLTSLQSDFPQPYLSYANKISVEWTDPISNGDLICRYTAPTDGIFIPNLNYNVSQVPLMRYYVNDPSKTGTHTTAYANYFTNGIIIGKGDVIELYDVNSATSYQYTGTIEFVPFARTNFISSMVSPIPDYANAEVLDTSDMPSTFSAGYLFNCKNGTSAAACTVTLTNSESDTIKIVSNIGGGASGANRFTKNAFLPLNGTETLSSFTDGGTEGNISLVPYSEVEVTPVLVSDVQVNGASVVDANGVAHITGGGSGGSTVTITPTISTGTKIATVTIDNVDTDLYAPNGGGGSDVSITPSLQSGTKVADYEIDGVTGELYAPTPTTYSDFVGTDGTAAGTHGLVPAPTASDTNKYLKSDGTWATVSGGGGASSLDDLSDVNITTPLNGQVLKYNSTSQKWENGTGGEGFESEVIYQNSGATVPASITLTNGISNYDIIALSGYRIEDNSFWASTMYLSDELLANKKIDLHDDAAYAWYTITNDTTLTSATGNANIVVDKVYGLKFKAGSGGGDANMTELTQGEYDALTPSEKENGTMYLTHDGDEEIDLTVRMTGYTSTSGTASAVGSYNANFLAWHAFASEDDFDANVNGEYWAGNGEGAYLQFDFANAVSITKVAYASYQYSSFDLMYSTDGTTYNLAETLTQADQGTTTPTKQDYILSEPIASVISIRFVCNGAYNIGALHIYGNDGNLTPNRIYLNNRKYAEVSNGITLSSVGLTKDEYDLLPSSQKEDTSKLYLVNDTGATAINMYYVTKYSEANVTITNYEHSTVLGWSSGNLIGQTWYYLNPIDVTNIDTIRYDIATGSQTYGSINGHNDVRNLGFGLRDTAPSAMTLINSMNFDLYNEYHDVNDLNKTLVEEELDVSEMTGEYYLIGTGAGWNAEISNIVLVSGDGVNKKYVYWDDTVYGESRSDNLVGEEMTLSEYELLPTATKKDGTVRFIPSSPASESEAIDMEHIQSFIENPSCMAVAATSDTLTTVSYLGNVYIGCNYYYTTPIDVTGWDKIIMDVETGNCYGGGTQATQQQFFLYIGLMENAPVTRFNPTQVTWVTSVNYGLSNHDYSGTELDVKELSGEYYLVLSCHGWSATIENIQLANLGGYASQIKYMDETYGISNIMELTEGDYQALTNVEKNNGTVYFTYDGGYEYISYDNGAIIVRVDHTNDKTLWFFNGFAKNANDMDIPTELVPYLPTQTSAQSVMMAKDWTDSTSTTTDGWIGFVYPGTQNVKIRSWNTSHYTDAVAGWAVLDIDGSTAEDGQTEPYQNPYTSTTMQPNHIYMNGRTYGENPSMDNYSISERIVGTWIDGSTVYQKTYTYSIGAPTNSWVLLDNTINKSDNFLVKIEGSWIIGNTTTSGNHGYYPLFVKGNFQSSGDVESPRIRLEDDGLYINVSQATYGVQVWATIQYTK